MLRSTDARDLVDEKHLCVNVEPLHTKPHGENTVKLLQFNTEEAMAHNMNFE